MLMRTDPFRELDRLTQQVFGGSGTWTRPTAMPMDAYREGDQYVVAFDVPGVSADAIDIDVERNMLTVKAERRPVAKADDVQMELSERPLGVFSRQLVLAEIDERLGDHLVGDSMLGIKALVRAPEIDIVKTQNVKEVFAGLDRFMSGVPQQEFLKVASGKKRHKL